MERLTTERVHYLAYIRAAIYKEVRNDNVVYHGHAGHLLLREIPQVLRVRVIADVEFRIKAAMERNNLSREKAIKFIKDIDEKRVKWTRFLYHADWYDPALYDIVINLEHISIDDACGLVSYIVSLDKFKSTAETRKIMDDMVLSTEVRATVAREAGNSDGGIEIEADGGAITISGSVGSLVEADKIREIARKMPGVKEINSKMRISTHW
jgi:cytidylate kinase